MPGSSTVTVHADREVRPSRAVAPPIYQTAAFSAADAETFAQAAVDRRGQDFYTRFGNPNHAQVASVVAELEHTEAAMVTASGMAALTTAVLALVSAGDHVIGQRSTYGGTASVLLNLLPRLGVSTTLVDQTDPKAFDPPCALRASRGRPGHHVVRAARCGGHLHGHRRRGAEVGGRARPADQPARRVRRHPAPDRRPP